MYNTLMYFLLEAESFTMQYILLLEEERVFHHGIKNKRYNNVHISSTSHFIDDVKLNEVTLLM